MIIRNIEVTEITILRCFLPNNCRRLPFLYSIHDNLTMITSKIKVCPTCNGTGYCDESAVREKIDVEKPISLETVNSSVTTKNGNVVAGDVQIGKTGEICYDTHCSGIAGDYESALDQDFLGDFSEKYDNFHDTLKMAIQKLKQNNWESSVSALLNIVHMSRTNPEMIDSSMALITRSLHSLLRNVRPQVVRTACQIAEELFKTMQCTLKPEFDELISALLQKTAYTNRAVRQDANRALDTMVVYITPQHCIRVMSTNSGAGHKNAIVRTTVSRLLYNIVRTIGVETFLTSLNLREARKRTFVICIQFLNDPSTETRSNGRSLMQLLMRHDEFDAVFGQDVERALIKKIEKQLVSLKYEESKRVN